MRTEHKNEDTQFVSVMRYHDNQFLGQEATTELCDASKEAGPTGAVPAFELNGIWRYCRPELMEQCRRFGNIVVTVYVED